jgi:hypothetical protein
MQLAPGASAGSSLASGCGLDLVYYIYVEDGAVQASYALCHLWSAVTAHAAAAANRWLLALGLKH